MSRPGVFGLPHLSEDAVASFADGVLSPTASARARKHCAECAECAAAVREQREMAMMLRAAPAPALPSGLLARLTGLPMSTSLPPRRPTGIGPDGQPVLLTREAPAEDDQPADYEFRIATVGVRPRSAPGRLNLSPSG
jgi:anti-sigma factor RsiW